MPSEHDQYDQFLDDLSQGRASKVDLTDDDTHLLETVSQHFQPEKLSAHKQRQIWRKAQHMSQRKVKHPPHLLKRLLPVASIALMFGMLGYVLSMLRFNPDTQPAVAEATVLNENILFDDIPAISDAFGFEFGAFTPIENGVASETLMQDAGMTWVASTIYFDVDNPEQVQAVIAQIDAVHGQGFKILLSVYGNPARYSDVYREQYAAFLGELAGAGADAIEIWQDANIDRSFPSDYLNVESYWLLLRDATTMIRAENRSTVIISGAPAPTGAQNAFPNQVINDDTFIEGLYELGTFDMVDCLGMQFVEGAVPPLAISDDARDNYYTRYLPTQLQRYRAVGGAEIPICITSLGYLALEGAADVPVFFDWASTTSTAEQDQWLREALEWLSLQADVEMAIVWHLDLDIGGSGDPQFGFDIHHD